jgi:protein-S-isoprenylcysteine O-methyltransferase Ste14
MNNETVFRLVTGALLVTAASVSIYHRRRADRSGADRIERREEGLPLLVALRFGGLALWGSVLAYLLNPGWMAWASLPLPDWARWAGVGGAVFAVVLVVWMFTSLGNNITDTVVTRQKHELVTYGPYRWIRHPLYSFGSLFFFCLSLIAANGFMAILTVLGFALLAARTPLEESKLVERFGEEYRTYMQRTGRFIPRLR